MEIYECNSCDEGTCYSNNNNLYCNAKIATWEVAKGYSLYKDKSGIIVQPVTEKKPELMTLQEAFEKAGDNDILECRPEESRYEFYKSVKNQMTVVNIKFAVLHIWQIIPEETKVLNADEWINSYYDNPSSLIAPGSVKNVYQHGDKNGQLKRDLDYRELYNSIKFYIESPESEFHQSGITEAFENLKPLNNE